VEVLVVAADLAVALVAVALVAVVLLEVGKAVKLKAEKHKTLLKLKSFQIQDCK
jgi:hypothetical protein